MTRYEDPSEDPAVVEAIINIQQALRVITPLWEWANRRGYGMADDLAGAQADLEQGIRYLRGEELPS